MGWALRVSNSKSYGPVNFFDPVNFLHDFVIAVSISELSSYFKYAKIVGLKFSIYENRTLQELEINTCE